MEKAKRFEDLWVWQQGRVLVNQIYRDFRGGTASKDFGFRDQVQRAESPPGLPLCPAT